MPTTLVAAFNAGFLMSDANGGYYTDNKTVVPLRTGAASFVVYKNGSSTVGQWGRDVTMGPDVVSVRQNLDLLVDNGQVVPAASSPTPAQWGATLGGGLYVWRSGLGVTADGALVYVGGPGLDILDLANIFVRAGAVRAMELDINTDWVNFSSYQPSTAAGPATPANGTELLPGMTGTPGSLLRAVVGAGLHHHVGGGRPVTRSGRSRARSRHSTVGSYHGTRGLPAAQRRRSACSSGVPSQAVAQEPPRLHGARRRGRAWRMAHGAARDRGLLDLLRGGIGHLPGQRRGRRRVGSIPSRQGAPARGERRAAAGVALGVGAGLIATGHRRRAR